MSQLLERQASKLFTNISEQTDFVKAVSQPQRLASHFLWMKDKPQELPWSTSRAVMDLHPELESVDQDVKPGAHPLHDQGYYYCLDISSVFAASVFFDLPLSKAHVLDMCAAPGGKSMLAYKTFRPANLICNETISKRVGMLISNVKRCSLENTWVTSLDPCRLSEPLAHALDLVIVDAPCSGQSLLVKNQKALGCFHPQLIKKNMMRQRRILSHAANCVAPGGYLAYMTCTYSREENESVLEWFQKKYPHFCGVEVASLQDYQSHLTTIPSYRLWPLRTKDTSEQGSPYVAINRDSFRELND